MMLYTSLNFISRPWTLGETSAEEPRGDREVQGIQEGPLSSNFFSGPQAHPCQEHEQTAHWSVGQVGCGEYIHHPVCWCSTSH